MKGLRCPKAGAGLLVGWLGTDMAGCWAVLVLGLMSADWSAGLRSRGSWSWCLLTVG